jgi:hypothetical protein
MNDLKSAMEKAAIVAAERHGSQVDRVENTLTLMESECRVLAEQGRMRDCRNACFGYLEQLFLGYFRRV